MAVMICKISTLKNNITIAAIQLYLPRMVCLIIPSLLKALLGTFRLCMYMTAAGPSALKREFSQPNAQPTSLAIELDPHYVLLDCTNSCALKIYELISVCVYPTLPPGAECDTRLIFFQIILCHSL